MRSCYKPPFKSSEATDKSSVDSHWQIARRPNTQFFGPDISVTVNLISVDLNQAYVVCTFENQIELKI